VMQYVLALLYLFLIYAVLAMALNIAIGYASVLSVGHASFYAVGAYSAALLSKLISAEYQLISIPFFPHYAVCILLSIITSTILGAALALLGHRLKEDYFLMATLAFGAILQDILRNVSWTGGSLGVRSIPEVNLSGYSLTSGPGAIGLALVAALAVFWICGRIERSPFGLALYTVAQDESLAITSGEFPVWLKVRALMISAGLTGLAGALVAPYLHYIDPTFFGLQESILLFAMVMIGGVGTRYGPVLGAFLLITIPGLLPFMRIPTNWDANIRQIIFGAAMILIMRYRPFGLVRRWRLR
jgi:branched-chain amino acid transport system permease protein